MACMALFATACQLNNNENTTAPNENTRQPAPITKTAAQLAADETRILKRAVASLAKENIFLAKNILLIHYSPAIAQPIHQYYERFRYFEDEFLKNTQLNATNYSKCLTAHKQLIEDFEHSFDQLQNTSSIPRANTLEADNEFRKNSKLGKKAMSPLSETAFAALSPEEVENYILSLRYDLQQGYQDYYYYALYYVKRDLRIEDPLLISQPTKQIIALGDEFSANISFTAVNKRAKLQSFVGRQAVPFIDGVMSYKTKPDSVGNHNYRGRMSITNAMTGWIRC